MCMSTSMYTHHVHHWCPQMHRIPWKWRFKCWELNPGPKSNHNMAAFKLFNGRIKSGNYLMEASFWNKNKTKFIFKQLSIMVHTPEDFTRWSESSMLAGLYTETLSRNQKSKQYKISIRIFHHGIKENNTSENLIGGRYEAWVYFVFIVLVVKLTQQCIATLF